MTVSFVMIPGARRREGDVVCGASAVNLGLLAAAFGGRAFLRPRLKDKEPGREP